jgi:hypothetical protein
MGTSSIRHIVEGNLVAMLQAEATFSAVNIYPGDNTADSVMPKVVVICDSANTPAGLPDGLGNYDCQVRAVLHDNANDVTLTTHRARAAAMVATLSDVAAMTSQFSSQGDAALYDVTVVSEDQGLDEQTGAWATVLRVSALCVLAP